MGVERVEKVVCRGTNSSPLLVQGFTLGQVKNYYGALSKAYSSFDDYSRANPRLIVQQDNAPSHHAISTRKEFARRGVSLLEWPPLNPIESVWRLLKDWIQRHYPETPIDPEIIRAIVEHL